MSVLYSLPHGVPTYLYINLQLLFLNMTFVDYGIMSPIEREGGPRVLPGHTQLA